MCFHSTPVRPYQKWSWAGDQIVHEPIIPAARQVPGTRKCRFDIDARQFLSIDGDAVLRAELASIVTRLSPEDQARFGSRLPGSFDYRVREIFRHLEGKLKYMPAGKSFDPWLFPGETLARGGGDCEDLAFALYGVLRAAGISDDCLRVAFGKVTQYKPHAASKEWHHVWVVYKDEGGGWRILEPMSLAPSAPSRSHGKALEAPLRQKLDIEYIPHFVVNSRHLWRIRGPQMDAAKRFPEYIESRSYWSGFDPAFAAAIHEGILDEALIGISRDALRTLKIYSFWVDVNVLAYDPRDHFDFSYIDEGWARVKDRLNTGHLQDLALALHAVADFYSHTLYAEFGPKSNGRLEPYDPDQPYNPPLPPYQFKRFAPLPGCDHTLSDAEAHWEGKLISGQWWRWYTTFPDELQDARDFDRRRCLPDHDLLAVDSRTLKNENHYYRTQSDLEDQYDLRRSAAVNHSRRLFETWKHRHGAI